MEVGIPTAWRPANADAGVLRQQGWSRGGEPSRDRPPDLQRARLVGPSAGDVFLDRILAEIMCSTPTDPS